MKSRIFSMSCNLLAKSINQVKPYFLTNCFTFLTKFWTLTFSWWICRIFFSRNHFLEGSFTFQWWRRGMFSSSGASFLSGRGGAGGGRGHCMGGISVDGGEVSKKTIGWRGALPMHPHTMGNPVHECLNRLKHCYLHMANLSLFLMSICSGYHSFST